jgi:hypothetical protein
MAMWRRMLHCAAHETAPAAAEETMTIKSEKDFWSGLMFIGFGVFFVLFALGTPEWLNRLAGTAVIPGYQLGSAVRMGPAYFPAVLGGLLAVLGTAVLVGSLFSQRDREATRLRLPFNIIDMAIAIAIIAAAVKLGGWTGIPNDYALLAAVLIIPVLAVLFRPEAKALTLILAACVVYGYLMKPLGLIVATAALVYISAFGGHEFKWKEVTILYVVLIVFSILVFVKALTLPFPICPEFMETCPIR